MKRLKGLSNDFEGRVLSLKFEQFVLVCVYVPNSGLRLKRLSHRQQWNLTFEEYLNDLRSESPNLIVCGDLNVAHTEIDLAHPKTNTRTAGFTVEERTDFSRLLEKCQLIDGFRNLYPEQKEAYTFWSYKRNARASNAGWRLDYFLLPETTNQLKDCVIHSDVLGSDHCPVELIITI